LFNPLNAKKNPICHLLALLGAHHTLHVSSVRVNLYTGNVQQNAKNNPADSLASHFSPRREGTNQWNCGFEFHFCP